MTRSSNIIDDLFKGYRLELESTSSSSVNISSTQNLDNITSLLSDFTDAYNAIYLNITTMTNASFSADSSTGPLAGDSGKKYTKRIEKLYYKIYFGI